MSNSYFNNKTKIFKSQISNKIMSLLEKIGRGAIILGLSTSLLFTSIFINYNSTFKRNLELGDIPAAQQVYQNGMSCMNYSDLGLITAMGGALLTIYSNSQRTRRSKDSRTEI